jgi:cell fate (sporulation/competence/biofilm development) regulator YlbF (YheA/YmcA/DUF963 family)
MVDLQNLLDQAHALGEAIAAHPRVREYTAAQRAVAQDSNAQNLLQAYTQQAERIRELERTQKPIEVADKQKLAEIEGQMAANEALKRLMRCQANYVELMNRVNQSMETPLVAARKADKAE